jgi:hypothetical protein
MFAICFIIGLSTYSQNSIISGYIADCKSGEKLIGVLVKVDKSGKTVSSNNFGFYSLTISGTDSVKINYSYIGYASKDVWLKPGKNHQINISICESDYSIKQIEITGYRFSELNQSNTVSIPMKEIKTLPAIFGEPDVLRAYMLMPGIKGGKEGTSELYVRGGSPDQNLIILDDIPLYYVNHIGGFVSIFDNNALKNVDLIKGGFPARYGGRLSAVADIRMKDGNMVKLGGEFSIGIISSKIMLEGPAKRNKSSFLVTLRRSIFDLFLRPLSSISSNGKTNAGYTFYDLNAKFQHKFSERDRIFLSIYWGRDRLFMNNKEKDEEYKYEGKDHIYWGNKLAALRWNHQFAPNLFMNITWAYTRFGYQTDFEYASTNLSNGAGSFYLNGYKSDISDIIAKADFDFYLSDRHKVKFGTQFISHQYEPGVVSFKKINNQDSDIDTTYGSQSLQASEIDIYIEDEIKIGKKFSANIGIHYSAFQIENIWFQSSQPRALILWQLTKDLSLKTSYAQMTQNIHLLTNSNSSQPTDLWVPATTKLKPENSKQYTFGLNSLLFDKKLELSTDFFYKEMQNLIEYKEGASFFSNSKDWQDKVELNGIGKVIGMEFLLRKRIGKTTGWIGYTISKNERQFNNLNFGEPFPYKYDRRHDISIVFSNQLAKNIIFSASWTFNTGYHITLAEGKYDISVAPAQPPTTIFPPNTNIPPNLINSYAFIYNGRNNYQTNAYHRLDLSCSFFKKLKRGTRTLNISIYNAYNNLNPYYIYYKIEQKQLKLYQYSLFPFMPSVSYSYKF